MELLRPLHDNDYFSFLAIACSVRIKAAAQHARPGHCMRVDDLPLPVMERLCTELAAGGLEADICLIASKPGPEPWRITATKAIELRNLERRPLLLFVPATERVAAEDSFGESTFTQLRLTKALDDIEEQVLENLGACKEKIRRILEYVKRFQLCPRDQVIRYLLTVAQNGGGPTNAGLAIYELGLIPDAVLFDREQIASRLEQHNRTAVSLLQDASLPLTARISGLKLREGSRVNLDRRLFRLLAGREGTSVREWGQAIATTTAWRDLSLDHWPFLEDPSNEQDLHVSLYLPVLPVSDEGLQEVELNRVQDRGLRLTWETFPPAFQVEQLDHFIVELVSTDGFIAYSTKKIKKSKGRSAKQSKDVREIAEEALALPEGVYYFRIGAFTKDGQRLNLEEDHRDSESDERRTSDTPDIWVYRKADDDIEDSEPERFARVSSFGEGYVLARSTHLRQVGNEAFPEPGTLESKEEGKRSVQYTLRFGSDYAYTLALSRALFSVEQEILAHPDYLGGWTLDYTRYRPDDIQVHRGMDPAPASGALMTFRRERRRLFEQLQAAGGVVETLDLRPLAADIERYAEAYHRLLCTLPSEAEGGQLASWLVHDQVAVRLPGAKPGDMQVACLLSPTHPIRLLWTLQYQLVVEDWLQRTSGKSLTFAVRLMRHELRPGQLPPVLVAAGPVGTERQYFVEVGQVTPLWSVYALAGQPADRGLLQHLAARLGVKGQEQRYDERISATELANRLKRYMTQHPYVNPLVINAVYPGEGRDLVGALVSLNKDFPELRYRLNLFGQDNQFEELGTAFEELLDPARSTAEASDEFADTGSLLVPKLVYTRVNAAKLQEGARSGPLFAAHVTVLYNPFPVNVTLREELARGQGRSSFVHGLTQTLVTTWNEADGSVAWRRQLVPTDSPDVDTGHGYPRLMCSVLKAWGEAMGAELAGHHKPRQVPALALTLTGPERSLLRGVHELSNWVITVDRHLGIEFFDQQDDTYLLDFAPEYTGPHSERLILTTNSVDEVESLLERIFLELDLVQDPLLSKAVLRALRALSGRLPMALSSSAPTRRKEVVGLALGRFLLQEIELLDRCIVVPLDAHRNWFTDQQASDENGQRGDLLLVYLDPDAESVLFCLVEVKVRTSLKGVAAYQQLRQEIGAQLQNTEEMLRRRYDPKARRAGWAIRAKELTDVLRFYMERAVRFGSLSTEMATRLGSFLDHLDAGFELDFRKWALVFDMENHGAETLDESGIVYYRIGKDKGQALVRGAVADEETRARLTTPSNPPPPRRPATDAELIRVRTEFEQTLPPAHWSDRPIHEAAEDHVTDLGDQSDSGSESETVMSPTPEPGLNPGSDLTPALEPALNPPEKVVEDQNEVAPPVAPEVLLGDTHQTNQWGMLGQVSGKRFAIDLDGCNTITLFGVQGGGKSYTLGSLIEMAIMPMFGINHLPRPLATVVFHYNESQEYAPEFVTMVHPNDEGAQVELLRERYGAQPASLRDVVLLAPADKVEIRKREFPGVQVEGISFHSSELSAGDWRFLMGVGENQAMYIKQLTLLMRSLRDNISLEGLRTGVENSTMSKQHRELALMRLQFAEQFISDDRKLGDWLEPGRLIIIDLRDELVDQDEALGLFVVMLNIFASVKREGVHFNKLIAFDEAHKYMGNPQMVEQITGAIRQMRHQGVSVLLASQDPPSLPVQIIELSSILVMHKFNSPNWLKHVQKAVQPLSNLTPDQMSSLQAGEAYVWANKSTDASFSRMAVKVRCRPRVTKHGGATKRATD